MFENQQQSKEPEDMFAAVKAAPVVPAEPPLVEESVAPVMGGGLEVSGPIFSPGKLWTTVGIAIAVLAIGGGTYWWVVFRPRDGGTPVQAVAQETPQAAANTTQSPATEEKSQGTQLIIDTDLDGLSDSVEATLRTDPSRVDTDADGLNDQDEVRVYTTNPLVADTDGDGFTDGVEVKNGYNPSGTGKLMNEQEDIQKAQQ